MSPAAFAEHCAAPTPAMRLFDAASAGAYAAAFPGDVAETVLDAAAVADVFADFVAGSCAQMPPDPTPTTPKLFTFQSAPGLRLYSGLVPAAVQQQLVLNVVEEYLPPPQHRTNVHPLYDLPAPFHLFGSSETTEIVPNPSPPPGFVPPARPASLGSFQDRRLRWVTLGGQYDWTAKVYPSFDRASPAFPAFPPNLAALLAALFDISPDASIVNFYSPGDTLSAHQDVAERSAADLVSVSLGCEAVFLCGPTRDVPPLQLRVRSGDVIVMAGQSRFAYHGVPKVWAGSCPPHLSGADFAAAADARSPAAVYGFAPPTRHGRDRYASWIAGKRINLNVRQML
ncbi:uncharacterized protein V1510DRAFT_418644 [Dipodascopsis tothii]|uniref:uncharacterized protein n=1 Tax=Dipodascopsis tothii TaxID=44089 RepID=UPI0034D00082